MVHVAGTDGFLFVDDGRDDAVFWLRVDKRASARAGRVAFRSACASAISKASPPTARGTTRSVRSRSRSSSTAPGWSASASIRRRAAIDGVESVSGLRSWVLSRLPSVASAAGSKADGFNIEGLAWDAKQNRLLMGLRSPVIDGQAVIIPLDLDKARDRLDGRSAHAVGAGHDPAAARQLRHPEHGVRCGARRVPRAGGLARGGAVPAVGLDRSVRPGGGRQDRRELRRRSSSPKA